MPSLRRPETKPAFGQVWKWGTSRIMLVHRLKSSGSWSAVSINQAALGIVEIGLNLEWAGLYDDPAKRLSSWELLSEED